MYAGASINFSFLLLFNILAAVLEPFVPAVFPILLVYLTIPCLCYHIFFVAGENYGSFDSAFKITLGVFLMHILIYSFIYWRSGLLLKRCWQKTFQTNIRRFLGQTATPIIAWIARQVPELGLELPFNAIGIG